MGRRCRAGSPVVAVLGEHLGGAGEDLLPSAARRDAPTGALGEDRRALRSGRQLSGSVGPGRRRGVGAVEESQRRRVRAVCPRRGGAERARRERLRCLDAQGHRLFGIGEVDRLAQREEPVDVDVLGVQEVEGDARGGVEAPGLSHDGEQGEIGLGGEAARDGQDDLVEVQIDMDRHGEGVRHERRPFRARWRRGLLLDLTRSVAHPGADRSYVSNDVVEGAALTEATSSAARSRSLTLRWFDARLRISTASS